MVPVEIDSKDDNTKPNIKVLPNSSLFGDLMTKTLGSLNLVLTHSE